MTATEMAADTTRWVLHADLDCFFAAAEVLRRPDLVGRPVLVGGDGSRGVVAAASYEARATGVSSAMPITEALRRCPAAVVLPPDRPYYTSVSARFMDRLRNLAPAVEPLSLDEAFVELTGSERRLGDPVLTAARLRSDVATSLGLRVSVGLGPNKLVAKLAGEAAKPRPAPGGGSEGAGVVVVRARQVPEFLDPMPIRALPGVGPATAERLSRVGVRNVADLHELPVRTLQRLVGTASARTLRDMARGLDDRPVRAHAVTKSISAESTFPTDRMTREEWVADLDGLVREVAERLAASALSATTAVLKIRFADFRTITRSRSSHRPIDTADDLRHAVLRLAREVESSPGVRLVGVGVSGLHPARVRQLELLDEGDREVRRVVEEVRQRFGVDAVSAGVCASDSNESADAR